MSTIKDYLAMQKRQYESLAANWNVNNRDPVVGSFDRHNNWPDYNNFLFKEFDTKGLIALEYGCGPGRNIVQFNNRFGRIDGVDISALCIEGAKVWIAHNNIPLPNLYVTDGQTIPTEDDVYDVVYSTICLQHICCYDIRFNIFKEAHRVLKQGGRLCFQMGYGPREGTNTAEYYDNEVLATSTNGGYDVLVRNEDGLKDDLVTKLGFHSYLSDIRDHGPGDRHNNWIWVQVQK